MTKRLKTIIIISSLFLVVMIMGVLLASVLTDVSSVEVYDFRVFECPKNMAYNVTDKVHYDFYLGKNNEDLVEFFNNNDALGGRMLYKFEIEDETVVKLVDKDNKYFLNLLKVGQTKVDIYSNNTSKKILIDSVIVNVYNEMTVLNVYLSTSQNNRTPFVVNQNTNGAKIDIDFDSTDEAVAKAISTTNGYFIEYYREGSAIITVYTKGNRAVNNQIKVNVYSNEPNGLKFVDDADNEITEKVIYTDGDYYEIDYKLFYGSADSGAIVNGNNIRISDYSISPIVIDGTGDTISDGSGNPYTLLPFDSENHESGAGVVLDKNNHCIKVKRSNQNYLKDCLGFVSLETYYTDKQGNEIVTGTYTINVIIKVYKYVGVEFEVSASPEFSDTHKNIVNYSGLAWKGVEVKAYDKIYFTQGFEVRTIFIKIWRVYNNGHRQIRIDGDGGSISFMGDSNNPRDVSRFILNTQEFIGCKDTTNRDTLDSAGLEANYNFCTFRENEIDYVIRMQYIKWAKDSGIGNYTTSQDLYLQDAESGFYTFNYFDERLRGKTEVFNEDGNIISVGI